jgi:hypothetical protein
MSELSNLIRQRIAGGKNVSQHPDADTITAYMEQCLSATERENVSAHFAVCEPCREVLTLSQPQVAELQTVLRPAPVPAWRRLFSPKFGIGALVASMAIIAVLVLQLPHQADQSSQNQQSRATASNQVAPAQTPQAAPAVQDNQTSGAQTAENQISSNQATQAEPSAAGASRKTANQIQLNEFADRNAMAVPPPPHPAKAPVLTAGLMKKDYVNTDFFSNSGSDVVIEGQNANAVPSAPQPQAGKSTKAFDTSATSTTIFSDLPASPNSKPNMLIFTPAQSAEHCKFCSKVAQVTVHTFRSHLVNPLRSSTISSSTLGEPGMFSGALQTSESVAVSPAPEKPSDADSLSSTSAFSSAAITGGRPILARKSAVLWKVAGGKLIKSATLSVWEDAYPAAGIQFSAVSAHGNDVWAGGSDAALIHSQDGGVTWEIVKLGDGASGNIVGITADSTNVQIRTSDKQTWSSPDGGKTWSLQQ